MLNLDFGAQLSGLLNGFIGRLDANGKATATMNLPNFAFLRGFTIYGAGITLASTSPLRVGRISNGVATPIQ